MATKVPSKASKPAAKTSTPAKKAAPASRPIGKTVAKAAAPAKKAVPAAKAVAKPAAKAASPAKKAPAAKPAAKVSVPAKKAPAKNAIPAKKVIAPTKVSAPAKKQAATPLAKKTLPAAKAPAKSAAPTTMAKVGKSIVSTVKKVAEKVVEVVTPSKPLVPQKAVIVPSKPAINPKPVPVVKKTEAPRSNKPVVIPKTSTNNKVDYNPEFKSVLDKPAQQPSGPTMRYSDAELQEFRDLINKKLDAAKKELAYLQGLITRKDEMGGDETDNRYMTMEDGSMSMEREQLSQMASRQITFIDHLEKAIMRIENKTYGICRVSGKLIDKARLRAVPHATLSMEAKLGIVK
ncbi:MAG TPA: TraR/DksA C4-type zinc finger protein [Segetibacter sp.]